MKPHNDISENIMQKMKNIRLKWNKLPEQVKRISIIVILLVFSLVFARNLLIPSDFGEHGHYRSGALEEFADIEIKYAGQEKCNECHDDIYEEKAMSYHQNVSCEVCHGPAAEHAESPDEITPPAPRERSYCPICHEYLSSRPTGFPQIISASHNPIKPCIQCHNPHDPKPQHTPEECAACHGEISRSKSLSHHNYIPCIQCHETPAEHKIQPREFLPSKPKNREFCGTCHSEEAVDKQGIPKIDMETHEKRYVCWQCHYPHLPEVR